MGRGPVFYEATLERGDTPEDVQDLRPGDNTGFHAANICALNSNKTCCCMMRLQGGLAAAYSVVAHSHRKQEPAMQVTLEDWDGDAAIRLPTDLLAQLGLALGDTLHMQVNRDELTLSISPPKPRYRLDDLIAQCQPLPVQKPNGPSTHSPKLKLDASRRDFQLTPVELESLQQDMHTSSIWMRAELKRRRVQRSRKGD
jgi:antitoxin ChpS